MEFLPRDAGVSGPAAPPDLESFRLDLEATMRSVAEELATEGSG
jgi:hypothetical protein